MENEKENNKVYIKPFIILFLISIVIFAFLYFLHSKNIENRFNNTLQNYEKSMSAIFNNMAITNGNNESINTNSFQTNNIENLKLSFEVGFKMLESSMNEIMKNSNDILQFWFAFLSVIMIVFTLIGFFLNNNILNQTTKQLEIVKIKSKDYINKIKRNAKTENNELIKNIKSKSEEETNKLIQKLESEYNQTIEKFKEENNELIENIKIKTNEETEKLIKELEDKYNEAIKDINKRGKEEGRKIEEESDKKIQENELFNFGLQSVNIKDYKSAIYYFTEVIKLNPKNSMAYNNRGNAKSDLSNIREKNSEEFNKLINEAIEDYNKAIELNTDFAEAYNNRGIAKYNLANGKNEIEYNELLNSAIKDYDKSIELNNDYYETYYNRALASSNLANSKIRQNKKEEYNKLIKEAHNDFNKSYSLVYNNDKLKNEIEKQLINLAKEKNEVAIKFCEEHNIDYKNYKE